jgi:hypothetical protein
MPKYDSSKDYYRTLGVSEGASKDEIDQAYRRKARKHHPDGGGSEEEMKSLNEARDVLTNSETRAAYDSDRRPERIAYGSSAAFDPEAASKAGTLKIPIEDPDFAGLAMGAAACFGLGLPLLLLTKAQFVFFLRPLQLLLLGVLGLGIFMSHSALRIKQRKWQKGAGGYSRSLFIFHEALFWFFALAVVSAIIAVVYLV